MLDRWWCFWALGERFHARDKCWRVGQVVVVKISGEALLGIRSPGSVGRVRVDGKGDGDGDGEQVDGASAGERRRVRREPGCFSMAALGKLLAGHLPA